LSRSTPAGPTPARSFDEAAITGRRSTAMSPNAIPIAPTISAVRRPYASATAPPARAAIGIRAADRNLAAPSTRPRTASVVRTWNIVV
jgi:hypothetical protein